MRRLIAGRLLQGVLTLWILSTLVFFTIHLTSDPVLLMVPIDALYAGDIEVLRHEVGLDKPLPVQYWNYMKGMVRGDFGKSLKYKQPVTQVMSGRIGNSAKLVGVTFSLAILISLPLGVIAAVKRGTIWDRVALTSALLGQSLPSFVIALILMYLFAVQLEWLPISGMETPAHYVLPAIALGWFLSAGIVRLTRANMLEVLDTEYVKMARIKGLSEARVVWRHALRNALIPVITFMGMVFGPLVAGAITTEVIFSWPGIGRVTYEATLQRDFPLLQGTVIFIGTVVILLNLAVDISYGWLDPRTRTR